MNPNWTRWIHASLSTFFTKALKDQVFVYIEGQHREMSEATKDWTEVRWTGPHCTEYSKGLWRIDLEMNFMVSSISNRMETFTHKRICGVVQASIPNSLPVFRYGSDPRVDDQTLLDCLQLREDQGISTSYLGLIQDTVELEQSSIETSYRMILLLGE